MAQFITAPEERFSPKGSGDGFDAMGKPIPAFRRQAGYDHCKQMGLDPEPAWAAVNGMSEMLERDEPYNAMAAGMKRLDLTGTYRLMAVLLTAPKPRIRAATVAAAIAKAEA